jgi:hypothetical protein
MQENTMREREREREREERGLDTKKWGNTQIPLSFHPEKRPWKKNKIHQSILQLRRIADEGGRRSRDPNSQRRRY